MKISLYTIKEILNGYLIGNPHYKISGLSSFENAKKYDVTFLDKSVFAKKLELSRAGIIIVHKKVDIQLGKNIIKVSDPKRSFAKLMIFFLVKRNNLKINRRAFVHRTALIHPTTVINPLSYVGKYVVIGEKTVINPGVVIKNDVVIGNYVIIYPNVTIMRSCVIENNVTVNAGTTIGSDGFGYVSFNKSKYKIPHVGNVKVSSNSEIGSLNSIDRSSIGTTWIKRGVKTDNIIQIAHNVSVGENTLIVSNVAIAGSSRVGKNVIIAGKTGIAGHINIGNNVVIGAKSGVIKDVRDGEIISGIPSMSHKKWLRVQSVVSKLPSILKNFRKLNRSVDSIIKVLKIGK